MTPTNITRSHDSWLAYGAAAWSFIFAVLHALWAAGWYVGLPSSSAQKAFQRPWFLIYDIVIAGLCGLGVVVALALARRAAAWRIGRLIGGLAWVGTAVLVLRGGGAVVETLYLVAAGRYVFEPMHLYTLWFCLGAVLFAVSTWRFWRVRGQPS